MGRRAKPTKGQAEAERALLGKTPAKGAARVHELEKRLAESLERENATGRALTEAREQQTATSEILRVISSSPNDVQPVFDTIVRSASRLCGGEHAIVTRYDGELLHLAAQHNPRPRAAEETETLFPQRPRRDTSLSTRALIDVRVVHVPDVELEELEPSVREAYRRMSLHALVAVPMVHEGRPIGVVSVSRGTSGPFSDSQVELLQTFADQAVIAIENVRLFTELQAKNQALTEAHAQVIEALEQQTATSEILGVISSSPTDIQPVFDTIVRSSVQLCGATYGLVFRFDGDVIRFVAHHNVGQAALDAYHGMWPRRPETNQLVGSTILQGSVLHVHDVAAEPRYVLAAANRQAIGIRTFVGVPMLRDGQPIGVIGLYRDEVAPFSDRQIGLVKTFASQAVIAIENVRLFKELEERNRALNESLEQQTATGAILSVISRSPTDTRPVFEAMATSAARLCEATDVGIFEVDGDVLRLVGHFGDIPAGPIGEFTIPVTRGTVGGRSVIERSVVHIDDLSAADDEFPEGAVFARRLGHRTIVSVPLVREGVGIGGIHLRRREVRPFSDKQIALLRTFADQAVIAVENVRLFTELQASNRELTTALDTQTATSDILRVISRSQTDVQPVFDAIVASAVRLLGAYAGALTRISGDQIELAAHTRTDAARTATARALFPQSLNSEGAHALAIRIRAPLNIADAHTDSRLSEAVRAYARARGYQSQVAVPLLRYDEAVGAITVTRHEPGGFTDDEIALLKTFADQAVIAIENARLLGELQARTQELTRSVGELKALGEIGQAISSTLDLQTVLSTIVARATQLAGVDAGVIYEYDEQREVFEPRATERLDADIVQMLVATPVRKGQGATGRLAEVSEPIQLADLRDIAEQIPVRDLLLRAGYRALLAVPLVREDHLIGGLTVFRKTPGEFAREVVELLETFATQSALAIQNARLFLEIEDKSRQLEAASQHKSEFLANMSHELRTPLNAIIGFSEVLMEHMFGELNEKQDEYLQDIYASGQHLLSLINDILDLSKIEAGRMELEPADFDLPSAIDNALTLVRERAGRREITLGRTLDKRLGTVRADERKIKQVLLNLLSNALKFTPEGGRIDVSAHLHDDVAEIGVSDTGVGIAPEDQEAVFEEFRQVGTADKKVGGTGLGLALSRKFIELHGGRIWVKSQVAVGSTFTFTLPLR